MVDEKKEKREEALAPAIIDEDTIKSEIYVIRGQKVMLDFDLARIYGYTTKAFNQQVNRNIERFDEDFRFQLTREEADALSRSQFVTSIQTKGIKGRSPYLPFAFTEEGIYMLMTVLKGALAIRQSEALIQVFKLMKDYIAENHDLIGSREMAQSLHHSFLHISTAFSIFLRHSRLCCLS